jgi:3-hydroxymyristoyl/3-hydroxydecanoyl-(acyl carrier protein) dehydratase
MAYKFRGEVYVDGKLMAEGEIMAVNHDPDA